MTIRSIIRDNSRLIVSSMGETWEYRTLTSSPAAETQAWSAWVQIVAHFSSQTTTQDYDEIRNQHRQREVAFLRMSDATLLKPGAQTRIASDSDNVWHVDGIASRGIGVIRYQIGRDVPKVQVANRDGGV